MKKENRKMAQERRAEERRKAAIRKKRNKILSIAVPAVIIAILAIVLIADAVKNSGSSDSDASSDTTAEVTSISSESSDETSTDSDETDTDSSSDAADTDTASDSSDAGDTDASESSAAYSTDTSLTVADGDTVNIDYVGSIDGVEFDGGSTQGMGTDLVIGSGSYIDDFEDQLIGAHPGDEVDVTVTFPDDYGVEDLNGKEAVFAVTVNGIYQ